MAGKKTKNEVDNDFNLDDGLDFDDFNFDMEPEKDDRSPAKKFKDGFAQGVLDKAKDTDYLRKFAKESLPDGYGQTIDMAQTVTQNIRKNVDEVSGAVKPLIKDTKRVLTKVIPKDNKYLPKKVKDVLERWEDEQKSNQSNADFSAQRMKEDFMNSELAGVFASQMEQQAKAQQDTEAKDAINTKIESDRFNSNFDLMNKISKSTSMMQQYQTTVTLSYQKKHLELEFRQLFTMQDILAQNKLSFEVAKSGLEKITKNTGLPEYAKIKESERFKDLMKNKFMNSAYGGLFKDRDKFINDIFTNIGNKVKGKVNEFTSGMRMGLMQAEQGADMAKAMGGGDDGMAIDKFEIGGGVAGDWAADKYGMKLAKMLRKLADKNPEIMKLNDKLLDANLNADRYINEFRDSDKYAFDDSTKAGFFRFIQSILPRNSVDTGLEVQKSDGIHDPYIYTKRTDRSINEIIPGYLARILREVQVFRTGDTGIQLTEFDHDKGVFASSSAIDKSFKEKLDQKYKLKSSNADIDKVIDGIGGDLSDEEKKALRKSILSTATGGKLLNAENLTKSSNFDTSNMHLKDSIYEKLSGSMANLTPEQKRKLDITINSIRTNVGDPRKMIQDMVNMGEVSRLKRLNYVNDDNGGLSLNMGNHLRGYYDDEYMRSLDNPYEVQDADEMRQNANGVPIPSPMQASTVQRSTSARLPYKKMIAELQKYSIDNPIYVKLHNSTLDDLKSMLSTLPTGGGSNPPRRNRRDIAANDNVSQNTVTGAANDSNISNIRQEVIKRVSNGLDVIIGGFKAGMNNLNTSIGNNDTTSNGGVITQINNGVAPASDNISTGQSTANVQQNSLHNLTSSLDTILNDFKSRLRTRTSTVPTSITPITAAATNDSSPPNPSIAQRFLNRAMTEINEITNDENREKAKKLIDGAKARTMSEYRELVKKFNQYYNDINSSATEVTSGSNIATLTETGSNRENAITMEDLHNQNQTNNQIATAQLMTEVTTSPSAIARATPILKDLKSKGLKYLSPENMKNLYKKVKSSKVFDKSKPPRDSGIIDVEAREVNTDNTNNPSPNAPLQITMSQPKTVRQYLEAIYQELIKISESTFKFAKMDFSDIGQSIKDGANNLKGKIDDKAKAARQYIKENFPELVSDFDGRYQDIKSKVTDGAAKAKQKAKAKWTEAKTYLDDNYPELSDLLDPKNGTVDEKKEKIKSMLSGAKDAATAKMNSIASNINNPNMTFDASLPGLVSFMAYKVSEYLGKGFRAGKSIFEWSLGKTEKMFSSIKETAKNMFTNDIYDVYVEGDNRPRLTAANIVAGKYHFAHNDEILKTSKGIDWPVADEAGQIIITEDELDKLYIMDPISKAMRKYKSRTSMLKKGFTFTKDKIFELYPRIFAKQMQIYRDVKDKIIGIKNTVKDFAFDMLDPPEDVYVVGSPTPALLGKVMTGGGYVSSQDHSKKIRRPSDIDGPVMDITGEKPVVALSIDDMKKGLVDANGKPFKSISSKVRDFLKGVFDRGLSVAKWGWGLTKSVAGRLGRGIKGLFGELSIEINGKKSADTLVKIHDFLVDRFTRRKKLGDKDGDGVVENSYQDYQKQKKEKDANKKTDVPKDPNKKDKGDGLLAKVMGAFGAIGGVVSGLTKGIGMFTKIFTGGIKALGTVGRIAWTVVKTVSTIARAASIGGIISGITSIASGAVAVGGAIVSGVGAIAGGIMTALSSPIVLPVLAVAAVAYGGYELYKRYKKNKDSPIKNIRIMQYGFDPNNEKVDKSNIYSLEDMCFGKIKINDRKGASIEIKDKDYLEMMDLFGIDKENKDLKEKFTVWFNKRFKPVFLTHAVLATKAYQFSSMSDLDKLEGKDLLQHIKSSRNQSDAYSVSTLPVTDNIVATNAEDVKKYIDEQVKKIEDTLKDGTKTTVKRASEEALPLPAKPTTKTQAPVSDFNKFSPSANKSANTFSTSATSVDVVAMFKNRIEAIDAIRFKIYGLKDMSVTKMTAIKKLEKIIIEKISFSGSTAKWDGDPNEIMNRVAGLFSIDIEKGSNTSEWLKWLTGRFMPTFLTFVSAIKDVTKTDKLDNYYLLKASDLLEIARRIIGDASSWSDTSRIWPNEEINNDPKSIEGNLLALEKLSANTPPVEQTASNTSANANTSPAKPPVSTTPANTMRTIQNNPINNTFVSRGPPADTTQTPNKPNGYAAMNPSNSTGVMTRPVIAPGNKTVDKSTTSTDRFGAEAEDSKLGSIATAQPVKNDPDKHPAPSSIAMADGPVITNPDLSSVKVSKDVNVSGLHPDFLNNVLGMAQEYKQLTGKTMLITSGRRTREQQEYLYRTSPKGKAARPGSSFHEFGLAVDMNSKDGALDWADKNGLLKKYGLTRPIGGEPWHVESAGLQAADRRKYLDLSMWPQASNIIKGSLGKGGGGLGSIKGSKLGAFSVVHADKVNAAKPIITSPKVKDQGTATSAAVSLPGQKSVAQASSSPVATSVATGAAKIQDAQSEVSGGVTPPPPKADPKLTEKPAETESKPQQTTGKEIPNKEKKEIVTNALPIQKPNNPVASAPSTGVVQSQPNKVIAYNKPTIGDAVRESSRGPLNNPYSFMSTQASQSIKAESKVTSSLDVKIMDATNAILKEQLEVLKSIDNKMTKITDKSEDKTPKDNSKQVPINPALPPKMTNVSIEDVPVPMRTMFAR